MEVKSNEKVVFFDKKSLSGPLSVQSKYIEHLAENDPDQPGLDLRLATWIYILKKKFPQNHFKKGVVLPNGTINWACPCLGTASIGPCSHLFRAAFKCFHYSEVEIKGSDCIADFEALQSCMKQYPKLYK